MDLRQLFSNQVWWGKIFCAFLGFLIAGPAGAFFGVFIGNLFDRGLLQHFSNPLWHFHTEKRQAVRTLFFQATFSTLGHIAKSDGRVSEQEIQLAKLLMQEMKLNKAQQNVAQKYFNEGKKEDFNLKPMLDSLYKIAKNNPSLLKSFIDTQYRAAQLDGLTEKKIQIINTILSCMKCAPMHRQSNFNENVYQYNYRHQSSNTNSQGASSYQNSDLTRAYDILQVQLSANKQEIKRAYRRLMSRHHPDKLIAQGMSKDKIKLANEKTQIIRKAYEEICTSKGW